MTRNILVLARRDSLEAMRVSAGLTIFGHEVTLVLMQELAEDDYQSEQAELLELADITPLTTVGGLAGHCQLLSPAELGQQLCLADAVVNL